MTLGYSLFAIHVGIKQMKQDTILDMNVFDEATVGILGHYLGSKVNDERKMD